MSFLTSMTTMGGPEAGFGQNFLGGMAGSKSATGIGAELGKGVGKGGGGGSDWQQWGGGKYMQGIRGGGTRTGGGMGEGKGKSIWDYLADAAMAREQRQEVLREKHRPAMRADPGVPTSGDYWSSNISSPYQSYRPGYGAYEAPPASAPTWSRTMGNYYGLM